MTTEDNRAGGADSQLSRNNRQNLQTEVQSRINSHRVSPKQGSPTVRGGSLAVMTSAKRGIVEPEDMTLA